MPPLALVTGANRGIGLEIVRQLAAKGVRAVIASRDIDKGLAAAAQLMAQGLDVSVVTLDVAQPESIARAVSRVEGDFGPIDILVNNAAILIDGPGGFDASLVDLTPETLRATFETNLIGPLELIRAVVPGMRQRRFGRVVNVSSAAGQLAHMGMGFPGYRMSKSALNALTCIAAAEVARDGADIKINAVDPGWVRTDMGGHEASRSVEKGAETVVWLATLPADGPTGGFFRDKKRIAW
jgi:NAD(P)-dependent dehydrogenase (short-subunit alcohol dehydrogenase family)